MISEAIFSLKSKSSSTIVHISEFHFYDHVWEDYAMQLESRELVLTPFGYMIASMLFGNYSFLDLVTVNTDICKHAELAHMADLFDEEAEK